MKVMTLANLVRAMKTITLAAAALVLLEGWLFAQSPAQPQSQDPPAPQAPVFRATVDVVRIDVQVVDRSGEPLKGLTPEDFQVSIDGKPRQIVSVDLVEYSTIPPTVLPVRT